MNKLRTLLPILLALLTLWILFCTYVAGIIPVKEVISRIAIPIIVYMASAAVLSHSGHRGRIIAFALLSISTLYECVIGVLQLNGLYLPNNPHFILTGDFVNQGLYGALMSLTSVACLYKFIVLKKSWQKILISIVFLPSFTMMLVSVSRAAWLGFILASIIIIHRETKFRINFRRKMVITTTIVILAGLCFSLYLIKPKSALARLHIWRMDCIAMAEHPLTGSGSAAEMGIYGTAQEHFFAAKQRSESIRTLADSPQFAFNEFLKFGMQGGIPALLLSLSSYLLAVVLLLKKRSGCVYVLIALGVFSLFSFPLYSLALCSILAVLLADASVTDGQWELGWSVAAAVAVICLSTSAVHRTDVMRERKVWAREQPDSTRHFGKYYPELRYDMEFISVYGMQLHNKGYYEKALEILTEGIPFTSNALHHCMIGYCQEYLGDFPAAQISFKRAMNMVPSRLTPYYLMILHYKGLGFIPLAETYRRQALAIPVDPTQSETMRIRKLIEEIEFEDE